MRLTFLNPLYQQPGPYSSVYLDTSRDTEAAQHEIELRWRSARQELSSAGAPADDLDALDRMVPDLRGRGPSGHAVFACGGAVVAAYELVGPPRRPTSRFAPLPHVMPLLAQIPETVPHVLVVSDRTGADISAVGRGGQQLEREVTGRTYPIHRVSAGGWAEKHVQQRVENTWEENARLVARTVTELVAEYRAELVLVSGEERSRGELIRALGDTQELDVVEVAGGSRAPGTDEDHFRTELDKLLADRMAVRIALYAAAFREQVGRAQAGKDGRAVDGLADALAALRAAQVDTLLINDDPSADGTLLIGPEPTALAQTRTELHALNVTDIREDRADAALARTAAGTDAELILVPREELPLRDGVGCLLRY